MGCDKLIEINATIFTEYFRNDGNLSNLNSWLVASTNGYCILDSVDIFSNMTFNDFFVSVTDSNLNTNINSVNTIVKTGDVYNILPFSDTNAKHFIPNIPAELIDKITTVHKTTISNLFNIYQFYDHLANNPKDIEKTSLSLQVYDFFTGVSSTISGDITKWDEKSHYENIIVNNSAKDKLTPSLIYVCRGIYLILLYKHIAQIYLSYYTECETLSIGFEGTVGNRCPAIALTSINTLMTDLRKSIEKFTLFSSYSLNVTYNAGQLTIDETGTSASTYFTALNNTDHIIYNITQQTYIEIPARGIVIDNTNRFYNISAFTDILSSFSDNDKCVILSKKSDYASYSYDKTVTGLKNTNSRFDEHKAEYQKSLTDYDSVYGSFNNIDYIYYLTLFIVVVVIVFIGASKSEQSIKTRVFIILIVVILIYVTIFSYLEIAKKLAESFSTVDNKTREIGIINNKFENCLRLIYMQASNYGMTRLYDELNVAAKRELSNVNKHDRSLASSIDRNEGLTNSEWHRLFQRTLLIHTVFLVLIVILTYLWLSSVMDGISLYLLIITIIAVMVLIFYYFRNLHRVVRSEYKQKYWTKMDV